MYDARSSSGSGQKSGIIFGVLTVCVVAAAFFGVLLMPGGGKDKPTLISGTAGAETQLLTVLDDAATKKYINTLTRVSPRAAKKLDAKVSDALADGADKNELAVLVMEAMQEDVISDMKYLAKADIRHIDGIVGASKSSLQKLSSSNSKWCKGSTYESFADMGPAQVEAKVRREFGYGSGAYTWGLDMQVRVLEAIEDAKVNPKSYGRMTAKDEQAVQMLSMRLISDPQVMKLMSLGGQDKAAMARAVKGMDFCRLAVTGLGALQSLPKATRERMWSDAFAQMDLKNLDKMMRMSAF